jgi:hypothetical protein
VARLSRREFLHRSAAGALLPGLGLVAAEAREPLPTAHLRALRSAVRGRVVAPGDRDYDAARLVFNKRFDGVRPPAVVQVRDTADVQAVVWWAGQHDVRAGVSLGRPRVQRRLDQPRRGRG